MKIVKLECENFKKLRAVEITPSGELVLITGKNGAGKSSVLDAIWAALGGAKHIQAVPIRKGADKARIRLDLGELIVERRFTPKGSTLVVENAEGARYTSPQGILDALLGALTFDPLAFVGQEPAEQLQTLRRLVKLDVDVDQLDGLNRRDYDRRTEINRDARALRAQADGIRVSDGLPAEPIDTAALMDRMAAASTTNAEIETRKGRRAAAVHEVEALTERAKEKKAQAAEKRAEAERLEVEAVALDAGVADLLDKADALRAKVEQAPPLPEPVDVDAIRAELSAAETTNRGIEARTRKVTLAQEAEALEEQARELTATMEAREAAKAAAITAAEMPVAGLGFGDGFVTFDGIPFEQVSSAEQLQVSVAIAMAGNPRLKVIRIKEGSLLDDQNLALIAEMARERGYDVWVERVDSSGRVGIYIEDGAVVAVDGEPVAAPAGERA